jgi:UDP-N-acetylmuramate dehydrogenase
MVEVELLSGILYSVSNLSQKRGIINIPCSFKKDEPLKNHTSFRIGGPADIFCTPEDRNELARLLDWAEKSGLPIFLLGEGANILVSDAGIRGLVVDLSGLSDCGVRRDGEVFAEAGARVSAVSEFAAGRGLAGIEFLYSMPGTVGGAVYMNARCYGASVSDVLARVLYIDSDFGLQEYVPAEGDFDYKKSPFMVRPWVVVEGVFRVHEGRTEEIRSKMAEYKSDRTRKGHFSFPSAGSVFKNNREFGEPSGKIIDSLGLRGYHMGGAQISPEHANIIINRDNATAEDVRGLIEYIKQKVHDAYGYRLEEEVRYVGEW